MKIFGHTANSKNRNSAYFCILAPSKKNPLNNWNMIFFYKGSPGYYAVQAVSALSDNDKKKLRWLFGNADMVKRTEVEGTFTGPRREMVTPWSTNAVEMSRSMGVEGIARIEKFMPVKEETPEYDPMLQAVFHDLDQTLFDIHATPAPVLDIDDIAAYNKQEGLALSDDEVEYLINVSRRTGRRLTDSEVYGFAQVNSEHCRHKIFNGTFIIDGEEKRDSLFSLIKSTSVKNPNNIVSAYKDNVAFVLGPKAQQFAPAKQSESACFELREIDTVLSLKAETHNFPTTVEPFNGAATGSGGEIRDRMARGKGSQPIAGTAVYMTSYPRTQDNRTWEKGLSERPWLYQSPEDILIKASDGASDFGNKFGQPLISGSLLTFEHQENETHYGYDKVIMLAGGVGFARKDDSLKEKPEPGDIVVVLGGDNYRIGMGGSAVSSVDTGEYDNSIELNAVQRSNPEMQKRVANVIRAMAEKGINPVVSVHDHGAGGHLNALSELVEETGGRIDIRKLPVGDPTLSAKEIIGNESQERMGLIIRKKDLAELQAIAQRERAPFFEVGATTGDHRLVFEDKLGGKNPIDLDLMDMFGKPPKTVLEDKTLKHSFKALDYEINKFEEYLQDVLQIEAVACKDWLTNKADRSVTGRVAHQQCAGLYQLPLNDVAVVATDYQGGGGIATSVGHAPVSGLIDAATGGRLSVAEALTNLVWAPLDQRMKGVSLSANWMWPAKNPGESARLYQAVEAVSEMAQDLGINIPTGKDSLSMTQKYGDKKVVAPGTVIISTIGQVSDIKKIVGPVISSVGDKTLFYIDFSEDSFKLGGSSLAQVLNKVGTESPDVINPLYFRRAFNTLQEMIKEGMISAGHDVSAGGLVVTLLEMLFSTTKTGIEADFSALEGDDLIAKAFSEKPAVVVQAVNAQKAEEHLNTFGIKYTKIGKVIKERNLQIHHGETDILLDVDSLRDTWFHSSYLLDVRQSGSFKATERLENYKRQPRNFVFPSDFSGKLKQYNLLPYRKQETGIKAAIIREKGVNGDREMAYSLYLAGFDVKDVHMTDLISGAETLEDVNMIVFVGGFSNSDVLGSAKGWAGAFLFNEKAQEALKNFYARKNTLSLGVCNGCQLMMELGLITPSHKKQPQMLHNESGKFESNFLTVDITENTSVMLRSLSNAQLGVWVAHGEGKFKFPHEEAKYNIVAKYSYSQYPGNPNGSDYNTAAVASADGRHLAIMPHLERSILPWQWALYPERHDEISPWIQAFVNAREWVVKSLK
jgi:phosphoribosylformylglycinamidine synthase